MENQMQNNARMLITGKTLKNIMTFLVALYFLVTSIDYVAKIGSTNISYLRPIGILIYVVGVVWYAVEGKIPVTKNHLLMMYLMAFPYLASLWAVDMSRGFSRAFSMATTVLVVFVASGFDFDERQIRLIEFFSVLGAVIVGILLISDQGITKFLQGGRIYLSGKESSDPNGMAARLFLPLILSAKLIPESKKWFGKVFFSLSFLMIIILFFMCGSRGALVSLVVGSVIFLIKNLVYGKKSKKKIGTVVIFLIGLIIILINLENILPDQIYSRLFSAESYEGGKGRAYIWEAFFSELFWKSPVIGYGTFGVYFKLGEILGFDYYAMHNSYFCMIGEYGIFYLPVFIAFLVKIRNKIAAMRKPVYILILYGICGVIFFLDAYDSKYFWNAILYLLVVSNCHEKKISEINTIEQRV